MLLYFVYVFVVIQTLIKFCFSLIQCRHIIRVIWCDPPSNRFYWLCWRWWSILFIAFNLNYAFYSNRAIYFLRCLNRKIFWKFNYRNIFDCLFGSLAVIAVLHLLHLNSSFYKFIHRYLWIFSHGNHCFKLLILYRGLCLYMDMVHRLFYSFLITNKSRCHKYVISIARKRGSSTMLNLWLIYLYYSLIFLQRIPFHVYLSILYFVLHILKIAFNYFKWPVIYLTILDTFDFDILLSFLNLTHIVKSL